MDTTSQRILRYIIQPCLVVAPFLILLVIKGYAYSPYVAARSLGFRIITEVLAIAWILLAIREPKYRPQMNFFIFNFVIFLLIMAVTSFLGEDPGKSFWGNLLRMEGVTIYVHLFAYIIVLSSVLQTREAWKMHFQMHFYAGFIFATLTILDWLFTSQRGRASTFLGNPVYVATYSYYMVFVSAIVFAFAKQEPARNQFLEKVCILAFLMHLLVIFLSGTRAVMLGSVVAFAATAFLAIFVVKEQKKIRKYAILALSFLIAFSVLFLALRNTAFIKNSPMLNRIAAATPDSKAASIRIASWKAAIEGAKERPFRGWGLENFEMVMSKHFDPLLADHGQWFDRAHNMYLDWLVATGIIGLLAILGLFGSHFWQVWRGKHDLPPVLKVLLTGMLLGYLIQEFFAFDSIMSLILWGTMAALVLSRNSDNFPNTFQPRTGASRRVVTIFLLCIASVILASNYRLIRPNVLLARTQHYKHGEDPSQTREIFENLLASGSYGREEILEELFNFVTTGITWAHHSPDKRASYYALLFAELDKEILRRPLDPRTLWFAARARMEVGDNATAITLMRRAKILAPKMPIILSTLGRAYFQSNDYVSTEQELAGLFALAPQDKTIRAAYVQILILNGKKSEAVAALRLQK
jgi:O-antigen ligase